MRTTAARQLQMEVTEAMWEDTTTTVEVVEIGNEGL